MTRQLAALLLLAWPLVACTSGASVSSSVPPTGSPVPTASAAPTAVSASPTTASSPGGTTIVLREAPANLGCDTIGIDYTSMTFQIDPAASEQVSALTDTGVTLATYWSAGFVPGTDAERLVRDPAGKVVVTDGEVLQVPPAAFPRLGGYFVCLGPDKLYVLLADPS